MSVVNFNDTTPAPPTGFTNIKWLSDASGNISANLLPLQIATSVSTDYTVLPTDMYVTTNTGVNTVTLPAAPVAWQILQIRNGATTPTIAINGNGHNVGGIASYPLYFGQTATLFYDPAGAWRVPAFTPSVWMNWTPTISPQGGMTLTSITTQSGRYMVQSPLVFFQLVVAGTIGGTLSNSIWLGLPPITPVILAGVTQLGFAYPFQGTAGVLTAANITTTEIRCYASGGNFTAATVSLAVDGFYSLT